MLNLQKFTPRFDRKIEKGELVGVHWNSHQSVWSIVSFKSRRTVGVVKGYSDEVVLTDVTFYINKSVQQKVRDKKAKDRHAFVVGYLDSLEVSQELPNTVYYNPYKVDTFVDLDEYLKNNVMELSHVDKVTLTYVHEENRPNVKYK